VKHIHLLVTK